jgi:hypothetical protein
VQFIKGGFSYRLGKTLRMAVWQQSFTNHRIRDANDYAEHRTYIQHNPVRAGLVNEAEDYLYSSVNFRDRLDDTSGCSSRNLSDQTQGPKPAQQRTYCLGLPLSGTLSPG